MKKSKINLRFSSFISSATSFLIITASISGIVYLQESKVNRDENPKTLTEYQGEEKKLAQKLAMLNRAPALGFDNLIADWVYLNFIQYFGDTEVRNKIGYSLLPNYFSGVVERDPHFVQALILMEVGTSLFAGLPQESVRFLDKALAKTEPKFISRIAPYYLWRYKGNNELLFLGNISDAIKSYRKSMEWAGMYDTEDSRKIANINKNSIKFLSKNSDSKTARIGAWANILTNNPDPKVRARVVEEIEKLGGKVKVLSPNQISVSVPQGSN